MNIRIVLLLTVCLLACSERSSLSERADEIARMDLELMVHEDGRVVVAERMAFHVTANQSWKAITRMLPRSINDRKPEYRPIPHSWLNGERVDPSVGPIGKFMSIRHDATGPTLPDGPNRLDWQYEVLGASDKDERGVIETVLHLLGGKQGGIASLHLNLRFPDGVAVTAANVSGRVTVPRTSAAPLRFEAVAENHLTSTTQSLPPGAEVELTVRW